MNMTISEISQERKGCSISDVDFSHSEKSIWSPTPEYITVSTTPLQLEVNISKFTGLSVSQSNGIIRAERLMNLATLKLLSWPKDSFSFFCRMALVALSCL